ncbi:MAG TPA: ATP-binding protein [Azospirillaceae bacterium]|nr:ATP-binding protein [Azospirillaceae bacterium]
MAAAILVLVAAGALAPAWALAAGAAVLAAAVSARRLVVLDAERVARQVLAAAEIPAGTPAPAPLRLDALSPVGRRIAPAVHRLDATWRTRFDRMAEERVANRSILDALHDPLFIVDRTRTVVLVNQAARRIFGMRIEGRDLAATVRNPLVLDLVDTVLAGGVPKTLEFTLPVPVESTFEARAKPLPATLAGPGTVAILTLQDITAVRRSDQMRADFVANASHELRTPLSVLSGFIETLRGPARDDPAARDRFLAIMAEQAERMSRLVNDLLSLSRIEQDERTLPDGRVDIAGLVHAAAAALELRAGAQGLRIEVDCGPDLPEVAGDSDQLAQVLQNLLDNAIKYTRSGTTVTVRAEVAADGPPPAGRRGAPRDRKGGRMVSVSVVDRGEGIPRGHLPRLTERFYRVDPARSRQLGGTGLGLAIVKHIVNRHRGRLVIESVEGQGSTFTVYLPAADRTDAGPHGSADAP